MMIESPTFKMKYSWHQHNVMFIRFFISSRLASGTQPYVARCQFLKYLLKDKDQILDFENEIFMAPAQCNVNSLFHLISLCEWYPALLSTVLLFQTITEGGSKKVFHYLQDDQIPNILVLFDAVLLFFENISYGNMCCAEINGGGQNYTM